MKKDAEHPISAALGGIMLFVCLALGMFFAWDATRQLIDLHDAALFGNISIFMLAWLSFLALIVLRFLILLGMAVLDWFDSLRTRVGTLSDDDLPVVTVIMPVFNEGSMIRAALKSLMAIDYPHLEIIVVDDGSEDASYSRAAALSAKNRHVTIRVLSKPNGGKADALNHGLAHARGSIVVCVDGDSTIDPLAVRHLVHHFDDPRVGAVAGNVRVINPKRFWAAMQTLEYIQGYGLLKRAQSYAHIVSVVPGPLGAFRKTAIAHVGAYESDTFAEDYDLSIKLLEAGWHIVYEPLAQVWTEVPESLLDLIKQRYRWTRGSLQVALKRNAVLRHPLRHPLNTFGMSYLWFDNIVFPLVNILALGAFVIGGLWWGLHHLMVLWWAQVLLLDVAIAAFCVALEKENPKLLLWAIPFRLVYQTVMDVTRLLASAEQFLGVKMGWGHIKRLGRL